MRNKEDLRRIFIKSAYDILNEHFDLIKKAADKIENNQNCKKEYENITSIAKKLMEENMINEEELQIVKKNADIWQCDLLPLVRAEINTSITNQEK